MIKLELTVEERHDHRVVLSLALSPEDPTSVDGVSLELLDRHGNLLAPRMQLPIAGQLAGPITTTCELRTTEPIPDSAMVVAVAWSGAEKVEVRVPTEPCTGLVNHIWGIGRIDPPSKRKLRTLDDEQRSVLARAFPCLMEPRPECACAQSDSGIVDTRSVDRPGVQPDVPIRPEPLDDDDLDELAADIGLSEDDAQWLKDLMAE